MNVTVAIGLIALAFALLLYRARPRRQRVDLDRLTLRARLDFDRAVEDFDAFVAARHMRRIRAEARAGISEPPLGHHRLGIDKAPARPESPGA